MVQFSGVRPPDEKTTLKALGILDNNVVKKVIKETEEITFSKLEIWFLILLCPAISAMYIYLFKNYPEFIKEYLLLLMFIVGPGTIGILLLKGFKAFKNDLCIAYVFGFNFMGMVTFMVLLMAIEFTKLYRLVHQ